MEQQEIRLDKWLWAARFYKTRAMTKQAIEGGKVYVNGNKAKPGKTPKVGDVIEIRQGWDKKTIIVDGLSEQRRGAQAAQELYHETEESIEKRKMNAEQRKSSLSGLKYPAKRPDKKQRRDIKRFKDQSIDTP